MKDRIPTVQGLLWRSQHEQKKQMTSTVQMTHGNACNNSNNDHNYGQTQNMNNIKTLKYQLTQPSILRCNTLFQPGNSHNYQTKGLHPNTMPNAGKTKQKSSNRILAWHQDTQTSRKRRGKHRFPAKGPVGEARDNYRRITSLICRTSKNDPQKYNTKVSKKNDQGKRMKPVSVKHNICFITLLKRIKNNDSTEDWIFGPELL
ncbi:unnamed protein product [Mytilus coruscus]|uniref:Uncharacterized protein n=1 Tax=Mytilus coruscus TaxID=42192 RepID=A0A6J8EYI0_MYTCO|nr:unnamed protein product [Mytilus coruscus]